MMDHVTELRKFVMQSLRETPAPAEPAPRLVLFLGSRTGVGTTSLMVNFGIALADQGLRAVVVDTGTTTSPLAELCGLKLSPHRPPAATFPRDIHEVLVLGPAGIQLVPGFGQPNSDDPWTPFTQERTLRQLRNLGRHADIVLLDGGHGSIDVLRRWCLAVDDLLLVTTPSPSAVVDLYVQLRLVIPHEALHRCSLIVNGCTQAIQGQQVQWQIQQGWSQNHPLQLPLLGTVPQDDAVAWASRRGQPFFLQSPPGPAARAVQQMALLVSRGCAMQEELKSAAA